MMGVGGAGMYMHIIVKVIFKLEYHERILHVSGQCTSPSSV